MNDFLKQMHDFLVTSPITPEFIDDLKVINYGEIEDYENISDGNALVFHGDSSITVMRTVTGNEKHEKRANFAFIIRRTQNANEIRRDIIFALTQTIEWINTENAKRKTKYKNEKIPVFSHRVLVDGKETIPYADRISADGAIQSGLIQSSAGILAEFRVQIHCDYVIEY